MTETPPVSTPFSKWLLRALLVKAALILILVTVADHEQGEPSYQAPREGNANDVVWYLSRGFDSNAYQRLAREGYYDTFSRNYPMGFPLLIRGVDWVVGNTQTSAVMVSNGSAVLALGMFFLLAQVYGRRRRCSADGALLILITMPGWLTFGTVAYSESTWMWVSMLAWWAYLKAEAVSARESSQDAAKVGVGGKRHLAWLAGASLLAGASVMVRHIGAPFLLALGVIELLRVLRASEGVPRKLLEACAALWAALPVGGYFLWKMSAHDLNGLQEDIWQMRFSFLGGPGSLYELGIETSFVVLIYLTLPIVILMGVKLRKLDGRLALLALLMGVLALSYTGLAAQSTTRYLWTLWPLALGAMELHDKAVVRALAGMLFLLSVWTGVGHVLGTAAL